MGVDLREIAKPKKMRLEDLSGRIVAVDAHNALHQFLAIIRGEAGDLLADRTGRITSHLSGLFYRNLNLLSLNVKPIYVFDGKPPSLKSMEIERRRAAKKEAVILYQKALEEGKLDEAKKYAQATSVIKDDMVDDAKHLLALLGIPWVDASSEGEATAAYLTITGVATDVASQDYDSLLLGAKRLLRNVTISGRRKLPGRPVYVDVEPEEVQLANLLGDLGVTREQLVDVGILLGTDFNPDGFKGIGPSRALKLVKTYGRLEDIPQLRKDLEKMDVEAVRGMFLKPSVAEVKDLHWSEVDGEGVIAFLCGERDFSEERVENALDKVKSSQETKTESLDRWFR